MRFALGRSRLQIVLLIVAAFACVASSEPGIRADEVLDNPDLSRTFVHPRILDKKGGKGIGQGISGACRLFGMDGYLKDYVVWASDLGPVVSVDNDGHIGEARTGRYVESMTCTASQPYLPGISVESKDENPDGSVLLRIPRIQHGPRQFPILSGHAGACRLLGYGEPVKYSLEWSIQRSAGVSLAMDGQIYETGSGTYLTTLGCKDEL